MSVLSLRSRFANLTIATLALAGLTACEPTISTHGHRLEANRVAQVVPGQTSREDVLTLLGSPSTAGTFDDLVWYYISQETEQTSFYQKQITSQDVVAIHFDETGFVREVDQTGLDQALAITPDPDQTRTLGTELSIVDQLVGNIGRFNTEESGARPGR